MATSGGAESCRLFHSTGLMVEAQGLDLGAGMRGGFSPFAANFNYGHCRSPPSCDDVNLGLRLKILACQAFSPREEPQGSRNHSFRGSK